VPNAPSLVLDAPTLLFVTALVLAFSGALMILSAGQRREATPLSAPLLAWGVAMLPGVVTVSTGVAALTHANDADPGQSLLATADRALYAAKAAGRNTVRSAAAIQNGAALAADYAVNCSVMIRSFSP
jgi:predicted signal transduction protein with EAL and GGDEF domain